MVKQILIGKVVKPHGIKGAIKCLFFDLDTRILANGNTLSLRRHNISHPMVIEEKIGGINFKLDQIDDRDEADLWRGAEIFMDRALLPEAKEDEFYLVDLIGARVEDPNGLIIGELVSFTDNTAQPLATIQTKENKHFDVPFVKPILVTCDPEKNLIVLDLPEGLKEINEK